MRRLTILVGLLMAGAPNLLVADVLSRYISCLSASPFRGEKITKRPVAPPFRPVEVDGMIRVVSVTAGYSMAVKSIPDGLEMNVKIERSDPAVADRDREIVRAQMREMSAKRPAGLSPISERVMGHIEILALHQSGFEQRITSFYSLLVPESSVIATVYVLRPADVESWASHDLFIEARDSMMEKMSSCFA